MTHDPYTLEIEVTVKEGDSSTARGNLLEALAKRVLVALQHTHVETSVRVTGCELDVVAEDKQSGAKIIVECKAYRDKNIAGEVLTKLMGSLMFNGYDSAWLITTSDLSKDARGLVDSLRQKSADTRQKLRIYDPQKLVELLISTGQIVAPTRLLIPDSAHVLSTRTLLISDVGEFWAVCAVGDKSGVADSVIVFDADSGHQVTNANLVQQLSERDSNLRTLQLRWVAGTDELVAVGALSDESLRQELDNIASVPVADDWSDYRPARAEDFVGRDDLLSGILSFFNEVRTQSTSTRLLAIKAPSGWGKSSFLIKLNALCNSSRNRDSVFLYSVDCRTASSTRYPELALKRCFEEAQNIGFISTQGECRVSSAGHPFGDATIQQVLKELRDQRKVIVLFFDQFEEITTKQELSDLFLQIKMLCSAIESASENVVLGFSWKTDGTIPTDHPAYHIWHSFSDRRREFELPLFSKRDMSQLLGRLSKELKQPIEHSLSRLLAEHCQGYPWLLKKLCVHVFRVLKTQPARQRELLERALDVEALFQKDLSDLDAGQLACLQKIAQESPADHFRIAEQFGDVTVGALMARRLIVRNAGKLILYWDIFRDYVLSKQVPAIPARYTPVSSPTRAKIVIDSLSTGTTSLTSMAQHLSVEIGTLDNVARDLVMMGVCQYDRKNRRLRLVHSREREILGAICKFWNSHALLRRLIDQFGQGFREIPLKSIEKVWAQELANQEITDKTIHVISRRLVAWLQTFGVISVNSTDSLTHIANSMSLTRLSDLRIDVRRRSAQRPFLGEAPPARVLDLLESLRDKRYTPLPTDRNALSVLMSLRVISSTSEPILLEKPPLLSVKYWLASKVLAEATVKVAQNLMRNDSNVSALEVGRAVDAISPRGISDASMKRYGSGIVVWVNWLHEVVRGGA